MCVSIACGPFHRRRRWPTVELVVCTLTCLAGLFACAGFVVWLGWDFVRNGVVDQPVDESLLPGAGRHEDADTWTWHDDAEVEELLRHGGAG